MAFQTMGVNELAQRVQGMGRQEGQGQNPEVQLNSGGAEDEAEEEELKRLGSGQRGRVKTTRSGSQRLREGQF